ncbi:MAG: DUF192 domain-containing protein [Elusimicrobiota bacterium]|jgi:hypothetical protein
MKKTLPLTLAALMSFPAACGKRSAQPPSAPVQDASSSAEPMKMAVPAQVLIAPVPEQKMSLLPEVKIILPDGALLIADLARTPETRTTGLMFRTELPKEYGMLFAFPQEQELQFWMKNTFVDLDMVWLSADKKVTSVAERVPRCEKDASDDLVARRAGVGRYVLELPAGAARRHKIQPGAALRFETPAVER